MTARRRLGSGWRAAMLASAAALAGAGLCACAGFLGIASDDQIGFDDGAAPLDGRAEASADAPQSSDDAQGEASDDAVADGPGDGAPSEAGTWCQQHPGHFFCSDFDEGPDAGWGSPYVTAGGTIAIDTMNPESPPASLLARASALASGTEAHAALAQNFMMQPTSALEIALDLRVDEVDDAGIATQAIGMAFGAVSSPYNLQLNVFHDRASLDEQPQGGGATNQHPFSWVPVIGQWSHFDIRVTVTPPAMTVTVDGAVKLSQVPLSSFTNGPVVLLVGIVYAPGPTAGTQVHVDDVTVDFPDGG